MSNSYLEDIFNDYHFDDTSVSDDSGDDHDSHENDLNYSNEDDNQNEMTNPISLDKISDFENMNSPLILPIAILLYSAFQMNTSGIPYMVFLIIFIFLRSTLFEYQKKNISDRCLYKLPFFGKTLNINVFVSIFTLAYILLPMIIFTQYNTASILILIVYTFTNIGVLLYQGCYKIKSILVGDIFFSIVSGVVSILIIIAINSSLNIGNKNFLFINNTGSSKEICSMPTKQNFKCNVYQNGQLVTQTSTIPNS